MRKKPEKAEEWLMLTFLTCAVRSDDVCMGKSDAKTSISLNTKQDAPGNVQTIGHVDGIWLSNVRNAAIGFVGKKGTFVPLTVPLSTRPITQSVFSSKTKFVNSKSDDNTKQNTRWVARLYANNESGKNAKNSKFLGITSKESNKRSLNDSDKIWMYEADNELGVKLVPTWYDRVFSSDKLDLVKPK